MPETINAAEMRYSEVLWSFAAMAMSKGGTARPIMASACCKEICVSVIRGLTLVRLVAAVYAMLWAAC